MAVQHTFMGKNGPETKNLTPLSAVRKKCLECSNFSSSEIKECPITDCALYPFRFGKNPGRQKRVLSEEQKEKLRIRLAQVRKHASE